MESMRALSPAFPRLPWSLFLFAVAFRERWLFLSTMIASLAVSPIIVVLQQDSLLRFLIKIRAVLGLEGDAILSEPMAGNQAT